MRPVVLVVEDEPAIAANVEYALRTDGFDVVHVLLVADALQVLASRTVAAVVLDVGLPDGSGFELCKQIRRTSDVAVLFVTARGDEVDRIVGLEIGADDYLVKPFSPRELVARVKTVLRRTQAQPAPSVASPGTAVFVLDDVRARILLRGVELELTRFEFLLLKRMLAEPERVFSREALLRHVGAPAASMARSVDTHVKSLRAKLHAAAPDLDPIRTHRGMGYSLHA